MKLAVFIVLSLFTSSIFSASPTKSDVEDLLRFIDKFSKPAAEQKVSPRTPLPKYQSAAVIKQDNNVLRLDYEGFTVWLDCEKRGAVKFQYTAQRDNGKFKRKKSFYIDPKVPRECQQFKTSSYKSPSQRYDRGHQVPANHLDYSKVAIKQTNYITNILPQAANMNRGAWLMTEEITECYRDIDELLIIGGVIWGNNPDDDYFVKSHGVKTPDAFWKVIIRGVGSNQRAIAWIVPNSQEAKRKQLDGYQVSVSEIERVTGEMIPVADYVKYDKGNPWVLPRGCDKG